MARYIDADALREPLSVIIENAEAKELYNIAFNYEHCLKMIEDTPTADVAPRAEVIAEYRKKVYAKMGKYTIMGREYIQRIMREVEKEMNGGEQYAKKP